jgi:multiple sugar transport system ATP-binding protein
MGDRVAVLRSVSGDRQNNLQQCAAPHDLYHNPANLFVASFIGSPAMTFLAARLARADREFRLEHATAGLALTVPPSVLEARPALAGWTDRDLIIGIRPEDFSLAPERAAGRMGGEVLLTEITGADAYVFVDLAMPPVWSERTGAEGDEVVHEGVTRVTVRVDPDHVPARGQIVALDVNVERAHFFDPVSADAIR